MVIAVMLCNAIVDLGIVAGSVVAAIHFQNWHLLFFMFLILVSGYSFGRSKEKK